MRDIIFPIGAIGASSSGQAGARCGHAGRACVCASLLNGRGGKGRRSAVAGRCRGKSVDAEIFDRNPGAWRGRKNLVSQCELFLKKYLQTVDRPHAL